MRRARPVTQSSVGPEGEVEIWPRPVHDGDWVDDDGVPWCIRGEPLGVKRFGRLMKAGDLLVAHSFEMHVSVVDGAQRADLLRRVEAYLAGEAPAYSRFELGEFRDGQRRRLLMVQESC